VQRKGLGNRTQPHWRNDFIFLKFLRVNRNFKKYNNHHYYVFCLLALPLRVCAIPTLAKRNPKLLKGVIYPVFSDKFALCNGDQAFREIRS
jgi:hypothetical protein